MFLESRAMKVPLLFFLTLLMAGPLWSQVEPSATGGAAAPDDDERMALPGPVSGEAYPNAVGDEERSNFLSGGVTANVSHDSNIEPGSGAEPISDMIYSILPTLVLNQTMPRQRRTLSYSAGFSFYDPTSTLNTVQQSASGSYEYRFSPRARFSLQDGFSQSSNAYNSATPDSGVNVSGSPTPEVGIIAPYAKMYMNNGSGEFSYQYSEDGMVGVSGTSSLLDYPNPSQAVGMYNFITEGGSGFLSRRFLGRQYIGGIYTFYRAVTSSGSSTTRTDTISLFYTFYLSRTVSISLTGGPQHYDAEYVGSQTQSAWTPAGTASIAWQQKRTNLTAAYAHTVTSGGGLLGTYDSSSLIGNARWRLARTWTVGASGSYFVSRNATSFQYSSYPSGHSVLGSILLQHKISERMNAQVGYSRLNQSYNEISSIANNPDDNRVLVSLSWFFTRPLGR